MPCLRFWLHLLVGLVSQKQSIEVFVHRFFYCRRNECIKKENLDFWLHSADEAVAKRQMILEWSICRYEDRFLRQPKSGNTRLLTSSVKTIDLFKKNIAHYTKGDINLLMSHSNSYARPEPENKTHPLLLLFAMASRCSKSLT